MALVQRILVGLIGALSVLTAMRLWFAMDSALTQFGVSPLNQVGRQTVRADMGGLFLGIGLFCVMAAWKQSRTWALGALVVTGAAIAGRLAGVLIDGAGAGVWPPIEVEAVVIAVLLWVRSSWKPA
jgi:hypothetical protein